MLSDKHSNISRPSTEGGTRRGTTLIDDYTSVLSMVLSTFDPVATDGVRRFPVPSLPVIG